jgi:hypothetical protein
VLRSDFTTERFDAVLKNLEKEEKTVKNKILLISLAAVLALSVSIIGCTTPSVVEPLALAFTDHNPGFNAIAIALDKYAKYIADRSCGKITITTAHAGEGLGENEVFGALQLSNPAYDAGTYVPESGDGINCLQVMTLPFMGWGPIEPYGTPQHVADCVYANLTANYDCLLDEFPSTLLFAPGNAYYTMPPVQIALFDPEDSCDCCNITTIAQLQAFIACRGNKPIAVMEDNVGDIIDAMLGGAYSAVISFDDAMQMCSTGKSMYSGFAQHLEFCCAFGIVQCSDCYMLFPGGILMTPIGILWNADSYDACVAKLQEACGITEAAAVDIMDGAADEFVSWAYAGSAADYSCWHDWLLVHDCYSTLTAEQTAAFEAAVAGYVATWEATCTGCNSTALYNAAKAAIAYCS